MWGRTTPQQTHGSAWCWLGEQCCRHGQRDSTWLTRVTYDCATLCLWQKSTWAVLPSQLAGTNHTLLLSPRAGTSCPTGRMALGGRRPGRMAGTATTMSSWTWEASSSHMAQVQCHHPWCPTSPAAPWSLLLAPASLQPLAHQDPEVALWDTQKLQIDGRISSLRKVCCTGREMWRDLVSLSLISPCNYYLFALFS